MNTIRQKSKIRGRFYPSILLLALASHYAYYYQVFQGKYPKPVYLVVLAMIFLTVGYFVGCKYKLVLRTNSRLFQRKQAIPRMHQETIRRIGMAFFLIGIVTHLYYYSSAVISDYGASYTAGRGKGYITVFLNFWVLGMIVLEYLSFCGQNKGYVKWMNRVFMVIYTLLYMFVLLKRRQVILLWFAVLAIWGRKMKPWLKLLLYIGGASAVILLLLFGTVRGYMDSHSISETIRYISENFTLEWVSMDRFEGQYMSMMLQDVFDYVQNHGHDPSVLIGVLFCMVPRSLLGGNKPLAFPEWYTKHFYPADYARGTGYAGSIVGELYLIGGVLFLILGYLILGYISARIQKNESKSQTITSSLVYALFIYNILFLPRYDLASLLIDLVFLYFPIIILCRGEISTKENI